MLGRRTYASVSSVNVRGVRRTSVPISSVDVRGGGDHWTYALQIVQWTYAETPDVRNFFKKTLG
jgi:hypothetical protein